MWSAKLIYVAARNPALAPEAFPTRWLAHAAMPRKDPARMLEYHAVSYTLVERTLGGAPGATPIDGVGMVALSGAHAIPAAAQALTVRGAIAEDELQVFSCHVENVAGFFGTQVVQDGPHAEWAAIRLIKRPEAMRLDRFLEKALAGPTVAAAAASAVRHVNNALISATRFSAPWDGVVELWFDERGRAEDAAEALASTPPADIAPEAVRILLVRTIMHRERSPPA